MIAGAQARQNLVGYGAGGLGHLVDGKLRSDQVHEGPGPNLVGGHVAHVDRDRVHGHAAEDRHLAPTHDGAAPVGERPRVAVGVARRDGGDDPCRHPGLDVGGGFPVGAKQLLAAGDIAGLDRRLAALGREQLGLRSRFGLDQRPQLGAGVVVTDHRDVPRRDADGGEIAQHIAGASRHGGFVLVAKDRYRRFR